MNGLILALDYGGTQLSAAIVTPGAREWLDLARLPSPAAKDARYDCDTMLTLARKLLNDRKPRAIGVSFGGPVDPARGLVILSHHVPGWENVPLRDQLQAEFGVPVSIENDANVAALGEWEFGAGQGCASLLYVTVSTGVGGGWVLDGRIFHGADSMAGEIGHTIVQPPPNRETRGRLPLCPCGRHGCVESLACGPAIARDARERLLAEPNRGAKLRALAEGNLDAISAEMVSRAANDGDELAQEVLYGAARALGFGIGTAITLMNPECVVVGGGVSKSGENWWRVVRESARANTLPQMRVNIVPAAFGDDAPLWGAVALAQTLPL
jgi:glucokinase